jgi:hypothetical protein
VRPIELDQDSDLRNQQFDGEEFWGRVGLKLDRYVGTQPNLRDCQPLIAGRIAEKSSVVQLSGP